MIGIVNGCFFYPLRVSFCSARRCRFHDALLGRFGRVNSPVSRPSHNTSTRSHMARISGSSDEAIRMAAPLCARWLIKRVDLRLGAHVDAARRLVQQQHRGPVEQALGQDDLLLVAAGQLVHDGKSARRLDVQLVDRMQHRRTLGPQSG